MFFDKGKTRCHRNSPSAASAPRLQAIADCDGDSDLDSAMLWLAEWHGLPTGLDGHDLSSALQGLDASAAAAVMAWEVGRFAPAGTAERTRAAATWREFFAPMAASTWPPVVLDGCGVAGRGCRIARGERGGMEPLGGIARGSRGQSSSSSTWVVFGGGGAGDCGCCRGGDAGHLFVLATVALATAVSGDDGSHCGNVCCSPALCHRHDRNRLHRLAVVVHRTPLRPAPESFAVNWRRGRSRGCG